MLGDISLATIRLADEGAKKHDKEQQRHSAFKT